MESFTLYFQLFVYLWKLDFGAVWQQDVHQAGWICFIGMIFVNQRRKIYGLDKQLYSIKD